MFCNKCGNEVKDNQLFCNKCGNRLKKINNPNNSNANNSNINNSNIINSNINNSNTNNGNINNSNNSINKALISKPKKVSSSNKKVLPASIIIVLVFAIIGALVFFMFSNGENEDYYFAGTNNGNNDFNNDYGDYYNYNNYGNTNKTPTKKNGKYVTDIENDHEYYGLTIRAKNDAIKLIQDDSVKQKNNNYPQEIINIENNIINKYGITAVNLKELDVDFAKEIEKVIGKIYNEYPQARGYITNLALGNFDNSIGEGAIAFFMPIFPFGYSATASQFPVVIKTQIQLNADYYLMPSKLDGTVRLSSKMGHFPANANKNTPVAHEFGHYLSFIALLKHYNVSSVLTIDEGQYQKISTIIMDFQKGNFSKSMQEEAYQNYLKDGNTKMDFDSWRAQISQYAVAKNESGQYNYDETVAEAFHDVYINGDNANIASKYIIKVLKKNIGG